MERVPQQDIETILNALKTYHDNIIATKKFNLQEFMNFMEPKFAEAGYRQSPAPPRIRNSVLTTF